MPPRLLRADLVLNVVLVSAVVWRLLCWLRPPQAGTSAKEEGEERLRERAEAAVLGALLGDALALQTHYEYDYARIRDFYNITLRGSAADRIAEKLRRNAEILGLAVTPGLAGAGYDMHNWHPGKEGGDLTDYGDCTMMALEFLASNEWSLTTFDAYWWSWIQEYKGYMNMVTKTTVARRLSTGRAWPSISGPVLGEDFFAVCRVPALVFAFRRHGADRGKEPEPEPKPCAWSEEFPKLLNPFPPGVASPFASEREGAEYCEGLGPALCGGVSCWTSAAQRGCALALPQAAALPKEKLKEAGVQELAGRRLEHCGASTAKRRLQRAAIESASVQYATPGTFAAAAYLATLVDNLLRQSYSTRAELQVVLREAAEELQPRDAEYIRGILDAVDEKYQEVMLQGDAWAASDAVEVDDLALRTFAYSAQGRVLFAPHPCNRSDCGYWESAGKASPTAPALTAVLYLFLRYAKAPLLHGLAVNAALGGDSAARAVALGALLGASKGSAALPAPLLAQLKAEPHARELLRRL